jgi:hypothetical protein
MLCIVKIKRRDGALAQCRALIGKYLLRFPLSSLGIHISKELAAVNEEEARRNLHLFQPPRTD